MLLVEFDSSMTIPEKLEFYYKHCNPEYAKETNKRRYEMIADMHIVIQINIKLKKTPQSWCFFSLTYAVFF